MKLRFCPYCGTKLDDGARFCKNCGESMVEVQQPIDENPFYDFPNAEARPTKVECFKEESRTKRKIVYDGEIHKCPNCGEIIDAYETVCESCGYELRGRRITSVVHELSLKLEENDDAQKKEELIRTFFIPNTREDIHEFFILALSNIKIGGMNTNAWMVKLEQAYQKAELSFGDSQEFDRLKDLYEKAQSMNRANKVENMLKHIAMCFKSGYAWALLFIIIGGCIWAMSGDFESTTSIVGMFIFIGGMWIALMTMINNDSKKKK